MRYVIYRIVQKFANTDTHAIQSKLPHLTVKSHNHYRRQCQKYTFIKPGKNPNIGLFKNLPIPIYIGDNISDMLDYERYRYFPDSRRTSCKNK